MLTATVPRRDLRAIASHAAHVALTAVLAAALLIELQAGAGGLGYGLLVGAGLLLYKAFGHKRDDADESAQGDHPVTRFMFNAVNTGDFEGVEDIVSDDFRAYADGYPLLMDEADQGPVLLKTVFSNLRDALPDVRWELYDEAAQKQPDKSELLALRFVSVQTIAGESREIEIATFARVTDKRLEEWRMVVDLTIFNELRSAAGLPLLD
ncbi:MAG: hypothetical protein PVG27_11395 [Chloroflexota bacterium]|jgi:hypothetical protein